MAKQDTAKAGLQAMARRVAKQQGIPESLFLALIQQESGWNPGAGSSAGAQGLTQLMPGTARGLGVRDLHDPLQNLTGGAKYLKSQLQRFGSPQLALSAYNSGPGGVESAGRVEAYPETQAYVKNVMALEKQYGGAGAPDLIPPPAGMPPVTDGTVAPQMTAPVNPLTRSQGAGLPTLGALISKVSPAANATLMQVAQQQAAQQMQQTADVDQMTRTVEATEPHDHNAPAVGGMNAEFARRLNQLMKAIQAKGGSLSVGSGARDASEQAVLWQQALKKYGSEAAARKWVAPPGKSNHDPQSGMNHGFGPGATAADLRGDLDLAHELAPRFGLTFPLSNEAWHIEPAGMRGK